MVLLHSQGRRSSFRGVDVVLFPVVSLYHARLTTLSHVASPTAQQRLKGRKRRNGQQGCLIVTNAPRP
jgi:hypothetical protein